MTVAALDDDDTIPPKYPKVGKPSPHSGGEKGVTKPFKGSVGPTIKKGK